MADTGVRILFRAAAGPRLGFGHLVRCRSLARALGTPSWVSLRATDRTRAAAVRLGIDLAEHTGILDGGAPPDVLVVDDPSAEHAEVWVNRARRRGVPVATIHDLGLGHVESDLTIDGSMRPRRSKGGRYGALRGPAYAILDPGVLRWREARGRTVACGRVFVALGGGAHVFGLAARLSEAIARIAPHVDLRIATGFADVSRLPELRHGRWVAAPDGLGEELARASVAVLAGGVTLYEACAIGVPAVALALTPAQGLTVRALASECAVIDGGFAAHAGCAARVAAQAGHVLGDARARRRLSATARAVVDGLGVFRVADRLRDLAADRRSRLETRDAA